MADFCKQCAEKIFPGMPNDLAGLCDDGYIVAVICEGCGDTFVDPSGTCVADCLEHHAPPTPAPVPG